MATKRSTAYTNTYWTWPDTCISPKRFNLVNSWVLAVTDRYSKPLTNYKKYHTLWCSFDHTSSIFAFFWNSYCNIMQKLNYAWWRHEEKIHLFAGRSKRTIEIVLLSLNIISETDSTTQSRAIRKLFTQRASRFKSKNVTVSSIEISHPTRFSGTISIYIYVLNIIWLN